MAASADHRLIYGDHADQFVEVWEPEGPPVGSIVLIHGGYWRQLYDLDSTRRIAAHAAATGWRVFNVEYRRVDEQQGIWPDMAADILHVGGLANEHPRIAIGHSAGGHLALWLAAQPGIVDGVIALAPLADLAAASRLHLSNDATSELFGGSVDDVPDVYAQASPLELVPLGIPTVVVHGQLDESVPQQLSIDFVAAATAAGDDVRYLDPDSVDHMHVIDPDHPIWRPLDDILDDWAANA